MEPHNPWGTFLDIKYPALEPFDIADLVAVNTRTWYNQTLVKVNDCVVRLGVVKGEYVWHHHVDEDEVFYVVSGKLLVDVADKGTFELTPGQGISVPIGVEHRTRAHEKTVILMVEGAGVVPSGD